MNYLYYNIFRGQKTATDVAVTNVATIDIAASFFFNPNQGCQYQYRPC